MEEQKQHPNPIGGCLALLAIAAIVFWCFIRPSSPPSNPTLPSSKLSEQELRQHRQTFMSLEPKINETRKKLLTMASAMDKILKELAKGRLSRLDAYRFLEKVESFRYAALDPEDLPSDCYDLLMQAETHYKTAIHSLSDAAQAVKRYLDSNAVKDLAEADKALQNFNQAIASAESKIKQAKRHLGFQVK